jgi:hypothetical protein
MNGIIKIAPITNMPAREKIDLNMIYEKTIIPNMANAINNNRNNIM